MGVLKSGSAYVPLDPSYPRERLAAILEDAKASVVLTQQALLPQVSGSVPNCICIDTDWDTISKESANNPRVAVKPENLGYVLFTSGSTGRPKGVALEHRSAVTFVHWAQTVFTPAELAGVLLSTSVCFDLSIFEIFVPLSVGGKIVVVQNALYLPTADAKDEVTLINTVPSAIAELVLWIGYLQWHFRVHGNVMPAERCAWIQARILSSSKHIWVEIQPSTPASASTACLAWICSVSTSSAMNAWPSG